MRTAMLIVSLTPAIAMYLQRSLSSADLDKGSRQLAAAVPDLQRGDTYNTELAPDLPKDVE